MNWEFILKEMYRTKEFLENTKGEVWVFMNANIQKMNEQQEAFFKQSKGEINAFYKELLGSVNAQIEKIEKMMKNGLK